MTNTEVREWIPTPPQHSKKHSIQPYFLHGNTIQLSLQAVNAYIHNGSPRLAEITGTGCMQGALTAVYLSASDGFHAAVTACTVMGICGELASCKEGTGSFYTALLDSLSLLRNADIEKYIKLEETTLEKI